jgi:hypothetical protein
MRYPAQVSYLRSLARAVACTAFSFVGLACGRLLEIVDIPDASLDAAPQAAVEDGGGGDAVGAARPCDAPHTLCADFDHGELTDVLKAGGLHGGTISLDSSTFVSAGRSARFTLPPVSDLSAGPVLQQTIAPDGVAKHLELRIAIARFGGESVATYVELDLASKAGTNVVLVSGDRDGAELSFRSVDSAQRNVSAASVPFAVGITPGRFNLFRVVVEGTSVTVYPDGSTLAAAHATLGIDAAPENILILVGLVAVRASGVDYDVRLDDVIFDITP